MATYIDENGVARRYTQRYVCSACGAADVPWHFDNSCPMCPIHEHEYPLYRVLKNGRISTRGPW